jgi:glycosyltransferase involved in cell wall biosynthesis
MAVSSDHAIALPAISAMAVPPVPAGSPRPLISVVLPVYEPDRYLIDALHSVLRQDPGPERMQIAIVDDASPTSDVEALVAEAAPPGRVEIRRAASNQGLGANWNECLRIARGEIVHLLHQDDWVAPGFYARLLPAFAAHPGVGMAFCRHEYIDRDNRVTRRSHRERWRSGPLRGWLQKIIQKQRIQCASALVRRSVYERLGGYRLDLRYALDWEMWVRIAAHYDVSYEPQVLACYRRHDASETARLRNDGALSGDVLKAIALFAPHLPVDRRDRLMSAAYASFARRTLRQLEKRKNQGEMGELVEFVNVAIAKMTHSPWSARRCQKRLSRLTQDDSRGTGSTKLP